MSNLDKQRFDDDSDLVRQERIRQARLSFNLAFVTTAIGVLISLAGFVLLSTGKPHAGTVTTAGGTTIITCCYKFAKDANDRLDKLAMKKDE